MGWANACCYCWMFKNYLANFGDILQQRSCLSLKKKPKCFKVYFSLSYIYQIFDPRLITCLTQISNWELQLWSFGQVSLTAYNKTNQYYGTLPWHHETTFLLKTQQNITRSVYPKEKSLYWKKKWKISGSKLICLEFVLPCFPCLYFEHWKENCCIVF